MRRAASGVLRLAVAHPEGPGGVAARAVLLHPAAVGRADLPADAGRCSSCGWPVLPWVARGLGNADRAMVRGLLSPSDELERRIAELESDRGVGGGHRRRGPAAHRTRPARRRTGPARRPRHGPRARQEKLLEDPDAAAKMVDEAHGEVKLALQELRDLARGIHPAILTDRGLDAALSSVAARCTRAGAGDRRPAGPAGRRDRGHRLLHRLRAAARTSASTAVRRRRRWRCGVRRTGCWSRCATTGTAARPRGGGSGLAGLAERLDAVDGVLVLDSPPGGPTVVTAELPWRDREGGPAPR